jgi:hypothetical protein
MPTADDFANALHCMMSRATKENTGAMDINAQSALG